MRICIITPAPFGSRKGNRVTAERWDSLLRDLGHQVQVAVEYTGQPCDVLVALHAFKSHASIQRCHAEHAEIPIILCLTGTDIYGDIHTQPQAVESLELATRLVVLQPLAIRELPELLQSKVRVIYQSVPSPGVSETPRSDRFEICVMGHLRPVKDPFRTAVAARLLPPESRIRVVQVGGALSEEMAEQAQAEVRVNPRYCWLGELPRSEALRVLARCRLLSLTSELEGGANVISESLAVGVPVVSSHIAGSLGLLGEDYPGYFPFGDTHALAALLLRSETEPTFYEALRATCSLRRPLFEPAHERQSWHDMLCELFPERERN